jgi:hypothetical protein
LSPVVPAGKGSDRPGAAWAAVDVQQGRVARAGLVANWQDQQPLDPQPVGRRPRNLADLAEVGLAQPRVEVGQLAGAAAGLGDVQVAV